jgi:GxxExxY protein
LLFAYLDHNLIKKLEIMYTKKSITQLSFEIVGLAIKVHKVLGPGLLESVYERCLKYELEKNGYKVVQQMVVPVVYDDLIMDMDLRIDLLVNDCILLELKAIENVPPVHEAQLLTYMKLLHIPQGLLINFFTDNITKSMKPFVNEYFRALPDE